MKKTEKFLHILYDTLYVKAKSMNICRRGRVCWSRNTEEEKGHNMTGNKKTLTVALADMKRRRQFKNFSAFIMDNLGVELTGENEEQEKQRRDAFALFRQRTGNQEIASIPTMKKWFGIGGKATPAREQIYHMCFAMKLTATDAEEFLTEGICEPAFQINDYQETIFVYGLENRKTYEECLDMIDELEDRMAEDLSFAQINGTQMLLDEFQHYKRLSKKEFMDWMVERSGYFKGYSKTTLNYFLKYKKLILDYVRQDAKEELEQLLAETDYDNWCRNRPLLSKDPKKRIYKYMETHSTGKKDVLSQDLCENIRELVNIAYTGKNANIQLLSEVFHDSNSSKEKENGMGYESIDSMTGKHLSDLLNISTQKERFFRVRQAQRTLEKMEPQQECPAWILELTKDYSRKHRDIATVEEARAWSADYLKEHKRRCLNIQRSDILPMILYVAQRRYMEEIQHDMSNYKQKDALTFFENLANSTLSACNMCSLNDEYELDAVLRACFHTEEMYTYAEVLEVI